MRLCKDCKHCIPIKYFGLFISWDDSALGNRLRCAKTKITHIRPTDGSEWQSGPDSCFSTRSTIGRCAPEGIDFEAK